ncbi:polyadenylate-binding protein-interacting protein 3-like [Hibiscus syriacus]|uniref:polyadenylate-binding protein-interacting protein 3-like n=1 Tax=Hibiscus syriacus TaxID=106335 RepID=UPI0019237376|nr:polyadenylate-binding protein-interacting protein 3-like [Hibiscus syriacus]
MVHSTINTSVSCSTYALPVNFGIGPSFPGHHPVVFNPQVAPIQSPQAYFHPTGPQYGQQMLLGQRPVIYYQPEMQYKGRTINRLQFAVSIFESRAVLVKRINFQKTAWKLETKP